MFGLGLFSSFGYSLSQEAKVLSNIVTNITVTTSFQYRCESKMLRWNWRCKCLPRESFVAFVNEGVRWGESCSNLASKLEGCAFDVYMYISMCTCDAADNLHGPDVDTVRLWKKQKSYQFEFQNQERSIMMVSEIYKKLKEKYKESRPIPFMMMEDETAIDQRIEYDASTDCVYGFCGLKGEQHKCEDHYLIKVRCCMQRIFTFKRSNFTYVELFGQVLLPLVTTGGRTGSVHIQHKPSNIVGPMLKVILNWCLC